MCLLMTHSPFACGAGALLLVFGLGHATASEDHEYVPYPDWPYFSEMVIAGDTIYLSGMMGMNEELLIVPGGIEPETRQTMENIRGALEKVDATMDDIVKCTVFLADMADWVSMNEVYVKFFAPERVPARSAVAVSGLGNHAKVEIECIAVRSNTAAAE